MVRVSFILLCLVWGVSFLLMKVAGQCFGPVTMAAGRVLGGAATLLVIRQFWPGGSPLSRRDFFPLLFLVTIGYAVPFWLQPLLIKRLDNSAFVGMMVAFVPLFTVLTSMPLLKKYPTRREVFGVIGGFLCLLVICGDKLYANASLLDMVLAVTTPLGYAVGNVYVKRRFSETGPIPLAVNALLLTTIIMLPLGLATEPIEINNWVMPVVSLTILGIISTGMGAVAFYWIIQQEGPLYAGMVTYVIPVIAVAVGWFLGDQVSLIQVIALIGTLSMVGLTHSQTRPVTLS